MYYLLYYLKMTWQCMRPPIIRLDRRSTLRLRSYRYRTIANVVRVCEQLRVTKSRTFWLAACMHRTTYPSTTKDSLRSLALAWIDDPSISIHHASLTTHHYSFMRWWRYSASPRWIDRPPAIAEQEGTRAERRRGWDWSIIRRDVKACVCSRNLIVFMRVCPHGLIHRLGDDLAWNW
jgi:hypothetical protein